LAARGANHGFPAWSTSQSLTYMLSLPDALPILTAPANQAIVELSTLLVTNTATDADLPANTLTFSLVSGPLGVSVNPTTGVLTWSGREHQCPRATLLTGRPTADGVTELRDSNTT